MKKILCLPLFFAIMFTTNSCLYHGIEDLQDSTEKELAAVDYTYRFMYNDTIKKGTPNQEILIGRVCEVLFSKHSIQISENGLDGFETTITYDLNSILKAGPTGSVTKEMLYEEFRKQIAQDGLSKLWVYMTISDAALLTPLDNAPKLGAPGDFSISHTYQVRAADGSTRDYMIKTVKGF